MALHHRPARQVAWETRSAVLRRSGVPVRVYPIVADISRSGLGSPPVLSADTAAEIGLMWLVEVVAFYRLARKGSAK